MLLFKLGAAQPADIGQFETVKPDIPHTCCRRCCFCSCSPPALSAWPLHSTLGQMPSGSLSPYGAELAAMLTHLAAPGQQAQVRDKASLSGNSWAQALAAYFR